MIAQGEPAPGFSLRDSQGNTVALAGLRGRKVVLYFYPRDDTPGCTIEAQQFTALASEFEARNTVVLGISKDSIESHCSFVEKHGLAVTLLSDPEHAAIEAYGAWREKSQYGKKFFGTVRCTYVIDESGVVVEAWDTVKAEGHAEEVLATL